jgi:hypothetical protein
LASYQWLDPAAVVASFQGRVINHFTDATGLRGIVGVTARALYPGQSIVVPEARFANGSATFLANAPGDIFITDLPVDASSPQLALIGVFGAKQDYVISMGEGELIAPARGIGAVSGGIAVEGPLVVTRR